MTSKTQKQFAKKKERERKSHARVVARRATLRAKTSAERHEFQRGKRIHKLQRDLDHFGEFYPAEAFQNANDETISKLEHNIQILKALEGEWQKDQEVRNHNHTTEETRINTLNEIRESIQPIQLGIGVSGGADYKFTPKETAEVSLTRDPSMVETEVTNVVE